MITFELCRFVVLCAVRLALVGSWFFVGLVPYR